MENNKYAPVGAFSELDEDDSTPKWLIPFFLAAIFSVIAWERIQAAFGQITEEGQHNYCLFYTGTIMAVTVFPLWKYKILAIGSAPFAVSLIGWAFLSMASACDTEEGGGFDQDSEDWGNVSILFAVPTTFITLLALLR